MRSKLNIAFISLVLILLIIITLFIDLLWGSVHIPYGDVWKIILGDDSNHEWKVIITEFRLPRILAALIIGGSLSLAGLMMQTFFRNPLAGPFVLGISSGASLGVAIYLMAGSLIPILGIWGQSVGGKFGLVLFSVLGALLVFLLVAAVSFKVNSVSSLLIVGMMFGSITGSIVSLLQFFSNADQIQSFILWTMGSLSSISWNELAILFPLIVIGLGFCVYLQKSFNALMLGDMQSRSIGVRLKQTRMLIIFSTCIIAGSITAFAGPIAFIGVAVPHLARYLMKTSDHKILLPIVFLIGSLLLLICDIISQMPWSASVLPINSVCALFGAPVIIAVVLRRRKMQHDFL